VTICRDNYASASDTIWGAWSESDMRNWLIENGYLRSGAQVKRDELVKAINDKYKDASTKTAAYLTWPDARLRAYLRERGVSERALPTSRPGLLRAFISFFHNCHWWVIDIPNRGNPHSLGPNHHSR
jgi:Putative nuclear envelope organisation protein